MFIHLPLNPAVKKTGALVKEPRVFLNFSDRASLPFREIVFLVDRHPSSLADSACFLRCQPPLTVPANSLSFVVNALGRVTVKVPGTIIPVEVGQLQLVNFTNPAGLDAVGGSLYRPTGASGDPVQGIPGENGLGVIMQGSLESSNVSVVSEMTDLIKAQRAYEMNSKVMSTADQMLGYTNNIK